MFNNKKPIIMKNVIHKTISILLSILIVFLYLYNKTDKTYKNAADSQKTKEVNTRQNNRYYTSEENKEFVAGFKTGFIDECKMLNKQVPIRIDNNFILKKIDITDKVITYSYQFEFDKSEINEYEWKDFIENSKENIKTNLLSETKKMLTNANISLSKTLELGNIKLEYIYFDINDSIIDLFQLDYIDFYGM